MTFGGIVKAIKRVFFRVLPESSSTSLLLADLPLGTGLHSITVFSDLNNGEASYKELLSMRREYV